MSRRVETIPTKDDQSGSREEGSVTATIAGALGCPVELVRRLAVSAAAVAAVVVLGFVPVPGVHIREGALFGVSNYPLAVGELGLIPFAVGFVLVEWIGMLWPGSPGSRPFGGERPDAMGRIAVGVGLGLAVAEAARLTWFWLTFLPAGVGAPIPGLETGLLPTLAVGSSLVAGASLYALAALWIRERGLGDGFAVVLGVGMVWNAVPAGEKFGEWLSTMNMHNLDVFGVLGNVLAVSVVILGTLWAVTRFESWVLGGDRGTDEDDPDRAASTPFHVPTAGVVPFAVGSSALWAFWTVRSLSEERIAMWFGQGFEMTSYGGGVAYMLQELGVVVGLGLVAGWVAARIDSRYASGSDDEVISMRRRAQLASLAFLAGLVVLDVYGGPLLRAFGVVNLVLVTAVAVDLVREWRFRAAFPEARRAATLHRTGVVGPLLDRLAEKGVPALARGRCFRGMLRTLGAFSAVEIYVPESGRPAVDEALADMGADS